MSESSNSMHDLPYDKTSAVSIFEYSKGLLGKRLRDFIPQEYVPRRGKGGIGQMVENLYFLLDTNNHPEADFSSAGMELKCTPLKWNKSNDLLIKERLVCNMINYCEVVEEDFEHSHFYLKCRLMLLLFYLYRKGSDNLDLEFLFSVLWKLPAKDLLVIKRDYETIVGKIRNGQAHLLSEGDTMYLGACRKGQKGDSLMKQPFSEEGAPRRAFGLKMAYMRTVLQYVLDSGERAVANFEWSAEQLVTVKELGERSFDEIILNRIRPYLGKNYQAIAGERGIDLSRNPKNKFAIVANSIVSASGHSNVNRTEEFLKAGLTMKTVRVQHNGTIKEAMSFENIDYQEVAECDNWYDSRLYELFSSRFLFVVFKERTADQSDYDLHRVFFWTMPQQDLERAEEYWNHIRKNVSEGHISEEYWWKGKDRKMFHVRPKARGAGDMTLAPDGAEVKKFCYWFNNDYVKQIVDSNAEK